MYKHLYVIIGSVKQLVIQHIEYPKEVPNKVNTLIRQIRNRVEASLPGDHMQKMFSSWCTDRGIHQLIGRSPLSCTGSIVGRIDLEPRNPDVKDEVLVSGLARLLKNAWLNDQSIKLVLRMLRSLHPAEYEKAIILE